MFSSNFLWNVNQKPLTIQSLFILSTFLFSSHLKETGSFFLNITKLFISNKKCHPISSTTHTCIHNLIQCLFLEWINYPKISTETLFQHCIPAENSEYTYTCIKVTNIVTLTLAGSLHWSSQKIRIAMLQIDFTVSQMKSQNFSSLHTS